MLRTRPQRWRARLQRYAKHCGQVATAGWVALQAGLPAIHK